jgi:hypothetical protein
VGECGFRRERILHEPTHQREVVSIYVVSRPEPGHPFPDGVDDARDV